MHVSLQYFWLCRSFASTKARRIKKMGSPCCFARTSNSLTGTTRLGPWEAFHTSPCDRHGDPTPIPTIEYLHCSSLPNSIKTAAPLESFFRRSGGSGPLSKHRTRGRTTKTRMIAVLPIMNNGAPPAMSASYSLRRRAAFITRFRRDLPNFCGTELSLSKRSDYGRRRVPLGATILRLTVGPDGRTKRARISRTYPRPRPTRLGNRPKS